MPSAVDRLAGEWRAKISENFYAALAGPNGALDPLRAAEALHHATRTLRALRPTTPYLWASHVEADA